MIFILYSIVDPSLCPSDFPYPYQSGRRCCVNFVSWEATTGCGTNSNRVPCDDGNQCGPSKKVARNWSTNLRQLDLVFFVIHSAFTLRTKELRIPRSIADPSIITGNTCSCSCESDLSSYTQVGTKYYKVESDGDWDHAKASCTKLASVATVTDQNNVADFLSKSNCS